MSERYKGEFDGRECHVEKITDDDGCAGRHYVLTADGNTPVRTGDYVVHGVARAPRGYHSQTIAKVVRGKNGTPVDSRLTLGDRIDEEEIVDDDDLLDDDDEFVDSPRPPAKKAAVSAKSTPAK